MTLFVADVVEDDVLGEDVRRMEVACSCVARCSVMLVTEWDGEEQISSAQTSFDFYTQDREDTWRQRLRSAWRTLRGKGGYYHGIVVTPEQAEQLGAWLLNRIERPPPTGAERNSVLGSFYREVKEETPDGPD